MRKSSGSETKTCISLTSRASCSEPGPGVTATSTEDRRLLPAAPRDALTVERGKLFLMARAKIIWRLRGRKVLKCCSVLGDCCCLSHKFDSQTCFLNAACRYPSRLVHL